MPNVRDMADPDSPNYHPSGHRKLTPTTGHQVNPGARRRGCLSGAVASVVLAGGLSLLFVGAVEPAGTAPPTTAATTVAVPTPDNRTVVERVCTTPGDDIRRSVRVVVDGRPIDLWCGTRYLLDADLCVSQIGGGETAHPCTEEK